VEWVETTGRTVDDAKEAALDQLGVDERDAEFEVVEEPRTGLFGRMRGEARVRARVRPVAPRPKVERRDRRRRRSSSGQPLATEQVNDAASAEAVSTVETATVPDGSAAPGGAASMRTSSATQRRRSRSMPGREANQASGNETVGASTEQGPDMTNDVTMEEQAPS
jgi:spoIIIJ-associated protein